MKKADAAALTLFGKVCVTCDIFEDLSELVNHPKAKITLKEEFKRFVYLVTEHPEIVEAFNDLAIKLQGLVAERDPEATEERADLP